MKYLLTLLFLLPLVAWGQYMLGSVPDGVKVHDTTWLYPDGCNHVTGFTDGKGRIWGPLSVTDLLCSGEIQGIKSLPEPHIEIDPAFVQFAGDTVILGPKIKYVRIADKTYKVDVGLVQVNPPLSSKELDSIKRALLDDMRRNTNPGLYAWPQPLQIQVDTGGASHSNEGYPVRIDTVRGFGTIGWDLHDSAYAVSIKADTLSWKPAPHLTCYAIKIGGQIDSAWCKDDTVPYTRSEGWFLGQDGEMHQVKDIESIHKNAGRIPAKKKKVVDPQIERYAKLFAAGKLTPDQFIDLVEGQLSLERMDKYKKSKP